MKSSRIALLAASVAVIVLLAGGSLALGVGAEEGTHRQVVLFAEVLSLVLDNYVDPVDRDALLRGAYEGMLSGLDAQGAYLSPEEVKDWKREMPARPAGPGLTVLKGAGFLHIVAVAPGSPAAAAGIEPGDQIRRIDGRSLRDLSLEQGRRLLLGPAGSPVKLSILHPDEGFKRVEVELARVGRTDPPFTLTTDRGAALLKILDLPRVDEAAVAAELRSLRERDVERLLIDLRDNAEGSPRDAARLAGLFVAGGDLLVLKDHAGTAVESLKAPEQAGAWPGPIGLLVNGATAGGAEALAVVLHARRGAAVYGEATYGLGAEPQLFELADGSGLLVSTRVWEAADGKRWNQDGLKPDTPVAVTGAGAEERGRQLDRTLELFLRKDEAPRKAA